MDADKRILRNLLRILTAAQNTVCDAVCAARVFPDELVEREFVAVLETLD